MAIAAESRCRTCGNRTPFSDGLCGLCRGGASRPGHGFADEQLMMPGFGVAVGDRYANRSSGTIVTVLAVEQRRYAWVTIRVLGEEQTITLDALARQFRRV